MQHSCTKEFSNNQLALKMNDLHLQPCQELMQRTNRDNRPVDLLLKMMFNFNCVNCTKCVFL